MTELCPYLFCLSFYLLYFFLPPFEDNGPLFWVPDVLCRHSEVVLWNLLSVQVFFWWICGGESVLPVLFLCHLREMSKSWTLLFCICLPYQHQWLSPNFIWSRPLGYWKCLLYVSLQAYINTETQGTFVLWFKSIISKSWHIFSALNELRLALNLKIWP